MTHQQAQNLVIAIAHWLQYMKLCFPHFRGQFERVVAEPLREYLTGNGYRYLRSQKSSQLERRRRGMNLFDYMYGRIEERIEGTIEVKDARAPWDAILHDLAKLYVLGQGNRFLLLVGDTQPNERLNQVLSFDPNNPVIHFVPPDAEDEVSQRYLNYWNNFMNLRRDNPRGRGYTPNIITRLVGHYSNNRLFVALYEIRSAVGRDRGL